MSQFVDCLLFLGRFGPQLNLQRHGEHYCLFFKQNWNILGDNSDKNGRRQKKHELKLSRRRYRDCEFNVPKLLFQFNKASIK
jgi:hypothetical protein